MIKQSLLKMHLFILFLLSSGTVTFISCEDTIPVIVLDYDKVLKARPIISDPFSVTTSSQFQDIIKYAVKNSDTILIFVENTFSREDVSAKNGSGTVYHNLRQGLLENKVKYFPSVENPYKILNKIFHPQPFNQFFITSRNYIHALNYYDRFKYFYIYFKDKIKESRPAILQKHDEIMKSIYFMVSRQTEKPVVAFYTGKDKPYVYSSDYYSYFNRNLQTNRLTDGVIVKAKKSLFYFNGITNFNSKMRRNLRHIPIVEKEEELNGNSLRTTMSYPEFELVFDFVYDPWHWTLDSISWMKNNSVIGRSDIDISAPWGRSYACSNPIVLKSIKDDDLLKISQYQVQLFKRDDEEPTTETPEVTTQIPEVTTQIPVITTQSPPTPEVPDSDFNFDEPELCSGYMSIGIVTCLLLTLMFLITFGKACQVLMNVNSNDRFDDVKKSRFFGSEHD